METKKYTLWTRDFTIITLGSAVSMLGNALSGFAMSLMVLDISGSTFLYAIYVVMYTLPQLVMPMFGGAFLDRFSRKKMIYSLDYVSAGMYVFMGAILRTGWFSFPLFAIYCLILGSIQSVYMVAYESFYPMLISEGNYQKAYSIASVLETLSNFMIPLSTFLYKQMGLAPLMMVNGVSFFVAAVMETRIGAKEDYVEDQKDTRDKEISYGRQMLRDIKEGLEYLRSEKGLMAIAAYFTVGSMCGGVSSVIVLPYFKNTFVNGEYVYMMVWGCSVLARAIGGSIHYKFRIPAKWRYTIALCVYVTISVFEGMYLFMSVPVMMALCFCIGMGGVTGYTIRVSATQSYVPHDKKGRFNGAFNMINTVGALSGELLAGALVLILSERVVLCSAMFTCALAALVIIGGSKRHVAPIYNREQ